MRWLVLLVAVWLLLAGVALGFPDTLLRMLDGWRAAAPEPVAEAGRWIDGLRGLAVGDLAWLLIGTGAVLLLAGVLARAPRGRPEMTMLFDFAGSRMKFVEHTTWASAENTPVPGTAYRVGVRNLTRRALPAVIVTIQIQGGRPATARFVRDGSYCADIAAGVTELVDIFMYRDQEATAGSRITETMIVRASAPGARTVARSFRFDSAAKESLVEG
jgi:hypothetical protein